MNKQPWSVLRFKGTGSWNSITLSAAAAVDGWLGTGEKKVKLTCAANHNLTAGSAITIEGTDNYDGTWKTLSGTATTLLYIPARYVAETTATADTCKLTLAPKQEFEFGGFKLHLDAASATTENLTITCDAHADSVYDIKIYSKDMNGVQDLIYIPETPIPFAKDDELDFAWANSNTKTYGLEVLWRRI